MGGARPNCRMARGRTREMRLREKLGYERKGAGSRERRRQEQHGGRRKKEGWGDGLRLGEEGEGQRVTCSRVGDQRRGWV
eukprot:752613-Hanusia_phi.AAC.3